MPLCWPSTFYSSNCRTNTVHSPIFYNRLLNSIFSLFSFRFEPGLQHMTVVRRQVSEWVTVPPSPPRPLRVPSPPPSWCCSGRRLSSWIVAEWRGRAVAARLGEALRALARLGEALRGLARAPRPPRGAPARLCGRAAPRAAPCATTPRLTDHHQHHHQWRHHWWWRHHRHRRRAPTSTWTSATKWNTADAFSLS